MHKNICCTYFLVRAPVIVDAPKVRVAISVMRKILFLFIFLVGCVSNITHFISVTYGEREALYFTGRGSAAGIMMGSLLGGAGVAVGIAIDEGIAKEISAALLANNPKFSMDILVKDVLREQVQQGMKVDGLKSVVIDKYGFQSASDDKVNPLLEMQFVCESNDPQKIKFTPDEHTQGIAFEQSKTDGELVENQLRDAVESLMKKHNQAC